ncbi:MAG: tetratricopeptide repeat protein [Bacteroidales bacterium]|nr:tetratricopeptide repeat protein [Bacteroidales bacterium]
MNTTLQPNYQFLSSGEKSILYTISLLPQRFYTAKDIYSVFELNSNSDEGVKFFDTLHGLTKKGWLSFSKDSYKMPEVKRRLLYSFRLPDQHYFRRLAENVTKFFSRDNNIETVPVEVVENQVQVATNILNNVLRPTKQVAILARNFSNYYKRKKAIFLALKYSKIAVDFQIQLDDKDEDMCCFWAERAQLLHSSGKYHEAISTALKALDLCYSDYDSFKRYGSKILSLGVLAASYEKIGDYVKSLHYAEATLALGKSHQLSATLQHWMSFYNAGISYFHHFQFRKAWLYLVKAWAEYCDENNNKPKFFSKLTFRRNFYEFMYLITKVFKFNKHQ